MTRSGPQALIVAALLSVLILFPSTARSGEPTDQLSETVNRLSSMIASAPPAAVTNDELPERVAKIIDERFDFGEMAKLSLGGHWAGLSGDEQGEFVNVFTTYVLRSYKSTLKSYNGEKISYDREVVEGSRAQVNTTVTTADNKTLRVDYSLHRVEESWKVYDIEVEQVSVVKNFRSQFNRVIAESSFQELLQRMKKRGASG